MKRRYISLVKGLLVLFIGMSSVLAFAAGSSATLQPNRTGLNVNDTIHVPIHLTGVDIFNMAFYIIYNHNVLTPITPGYTLNPAYLGVFSVTGYSATYNDSTLFIGIDAVGFTGTDFTGQKIVDLLFTFKGGQTNLHIRKSPEPGTPPYSNIWDDLAGKILPYTFTDASVGGAIHSANTGGAWNATGSWEVACVPNNLCDVYITRTNPVTITANATAKTLTINSGGQLTLNASTTLNVTGNFSILDNGTNGSGSYVDFGTTTIGGTCSVQRYMNGNWISGKPTGSTIWHYISSPVASGTINTFLGDLLNKWNEPLEQWDSLVLPLSIPLTVGKGFAAAPRTPGGTKTFTGGTLNTGDLTVSGLTYTAGTYAGYNLIGNIYPSALLWDGSWSKTNVDGSAWVWDNTVGHYWVNNGGTGTGSFGTNGIIPPEQGFFVHVTAAGTASITIPNAKRQHSTQDFYKQDIADFINLKLEGNNGYDEAVIYFDPNATTGYDPELDAYKLFGGSSATEIYSVIVGNTNASINVLPGYQGSTVIPVGIKTGATGTYTLTASKLESFASGTSVYLEDLLTTNHTTVKLNDNPVYTFTSDAVNTVRFNLHFAPVGIPEIGSNKINIYSNLKDVYVNIPVSMHGNIFVYNLLGSEITNQVIEGNTLNRISLNSPTGYYIVKVIGDNGITTGKVFIQ